MKKLPLPSELCYLLGMMVLAIGTVFMEHAELGLAPIVAPAYVIHDWLSPYLPWLSFGVATFLFQGILLLVLALILQRFNLYFLFSFLSGFLMGTLFDVVEALLTKIPTGSLWLFSHETGARVCLLFLGIILYSAGVSLLLFSYFAPEVYELFVDELSLAYGWRFPLVKTIYDCASILLALVISFIALGHVDLRGVGLGSVIFAILDGGFIALFSALNKRIIRGVDLLPWRRFFHRDEEEKAGEEANH